MNGTGLWMVEVVVRKITKILDINFPDDVNENINNVTNDFNDKNIASWIRQTVTLNKSFEDKNINLRLAPGDLEYMIIEKAGDDRLNELKVKLDMDKHVSKDEILRRLGSKGVDGTVVNNAVKAPYIRAFIGKKIKSSEVSPSLRKILEQWVKPLGVSKNKIADIAKRING